MRSARPPAGARTFSSMMWIVRSCSRRWPRPARKRAGRCMPIERTTPGSSTAKPPSKRPSGSSRKNWRARVGRNPTWPVGQRMTRASWPSPRASGKRRLTLHTTPIPTYGLPPFQNGSAKKSHTRTVKDVPEGNYRATKVLAARRCASATCSGVKAIISKVSRLCTALVLPLEAEDNTTYMPRPNS